MANMLYKKLIDILARTGNVTEDQATLNLDRLIRLNKNVIQPVEDSIREVDRFKSIVSDVIEKMAPFLMAAMKK